MNRYLPHSSPRLFLAIGIWMICILVGFSLARRYSNTPGASAELSSHWPSNSKLKSDESLYHLLVFLLPKCPCSRATLGELENLMPKLIQKAKVQVIFSVPEGATAYENEWNDTELVRKAKSIPGVAVTIDNNGNETRTFSAKTSGQTFLYNSKGDLLFQGGITASRGHMGDSLGKTAILNLVNGTSNSVSKSAVFGCALHNPSHKIKRENNL